MRPVIVEFFRDDVDRLWPEKSIRQRAGRGPQPTLRDQIVHQMRGTYGSSAAGMTLLRTMKDKELVANVHGSRDVVRKARTIVLETPDKLQTKNK